MVPVLSRGQIRAFDQWAIGQGVPSLILMENAGRGATQIMIRELARRGRALGPRSPILLVCGVGNNGGDGLVMARQLAVRGITPRVLILGELERLSEDARANYRAFLGIGGTVEVLAPGAALTVLEEQVQTAEVLVDALLGTGLTRPLQGWLETAVKAMSRAPGFRVAVDIPSGLDANRGAVLGTAMQADLTITFGFLKLGLLTSLGAYFSGDIQVVDIGVPPRWVTAVGHSAELVESSDCLRHLPRRPVMAHKGMAGRVWVVGGSPGKTGAALLSARGALRAGAGLVTVATSRAAREALERRVLEEMTAEIDFDDLPGVLAQLAQADALVLGPGLGLDSKARALVERLVVELDCPKIVDADGITLLAGSPEIFAAAKGPLVLTPHPGELGRLLQISPQEIESDRYGCLARAVELTRATVLLKGPHTLVGAPGRLPRVNDTGCSALATGGAGDVLSGIIGALLVSLPPYEAAWVGAHWHGLAAEAWSAEAGSQAQPADRGLLAHEIADALPQVLAALQTAAVANRQVPLPD